MTSGRALRPLADAVWLQCACVSLTRRLPSFPDDWLAPSSSISFGNLSRKKTTSLPGIVRSMQLSHIPHACSWKAEIIALIVLLSETMIQVWPPLCQIPCIAYEILLKFDSNLASEWTHCKHIASCWLLSETYTVCQFRIPCKRLRDFALQKSLSGLLILPWNNLHCNEHITHLIRSQIFEDSFVQNYYCRLSQFQWLIHENTGQVGTIHLFMEI